jgi:hypothetical protein
MILGEGETEREVFDLPITYCRDNPAVDAFVQAKILDFNPYRVPETARDIVDAAIDEFGYFNCFWIEIQPH